MKIIFNNKDTKFREITIVKNAWTGRSSILVNGNLATNIGKDQFIYKDNQGAYFEMTLKGNEITGIDLTINNKTINVLRKLTVLEMILSIIPLFLLLGGVIGGICGAIGAVIVFTVCRNVNNLLIKISISLGVYVFITITYILLGKLVLSII